MNKCIACGKDVENFYEDYCVECREIIGMGLLEMAINDKKEKEVKK